MHRMKRDIQLAFIILTAAVAHSERIDYCNLPSCPGRSHTACKFPSSLSHQRCGNGVYVGLSNADRKILRKEHLKVTQFARLSRRRQLLRRGLPIPHDTSVLEWDDELAKTAQKWANQCENRIDQCRNDPRFEVDQRIAIRELVDGVLQPSYASIIENWYFEDPLVDDHSATQNASHFTRSLWESAHKFGCGELGTYVTSRQTSYFVCNYAPLDYTVPFNTNYQ